MNNGYQPYPPYPPRPYGPDWPGPNVHPDWPHYRYWHHWNDSEPAALVPWNAPCCPPSADECVCVTYQDINMWNTISAVSAFTALNIGDFSGLSALSGISEMLSAAWIVGENWVDWSSAASAVPDIYGQLSAISASVNKRAYKTECDKKLDRVYSDPNYFAGLGTSANILGFTAPARLAINKVWDATYVGSGSFDDPNNFPWNLVTNKECDKVFSAISLIKARLEEFETRLERFTSRVNALAAGQTSVIETNRLDKMESRISKLESEVNNK